jgi:hypothetical protein
MGLWKAISKWALTPAGAVVPPKGTITLDDVLDKYDVVDVAYDPEAEGGGKSYIVVTDKGYAPGLFGEYYNARGELSTPHSAEGKLLAERNGGVKQFAIREGALGNLGEIGSSSPSPFTSFTRQEYNPELQGLLGLKKYDRMRRSDGTVRKTLREVKTPVLAARWFVEAAGDTNADKQAADLVWKNLTEFMTISFTQVLTEALLMMEFGYYMFEKVWDIRIIDGQPRMIWKKLAPRHPMDVAEWHYDPNGGPLAVELYPPSADVFQDNIVIPIDKMLVFSFDREAGNIEGISILRSAYKHWYYKEQLYKIDAIQKERHGIGIPIIKLPPNWNDSDRRLAEELGRNVRTNERAHIVLPPQWDFMFAKVEGNAVDVLKSIDHHDREIEKNILAPEKQGKSEDYDMFFKGTRYVADIVTDAFNLYGIPQLVDYNFFRGLSGYPKLRARRIGEQNDWRTMSFAIRNLVGAGVLTPDEKLEEFVRNEMDLPKVDMDTRREVATPQVPRPQPGRAGPPRQGAPSPRPVPPAQAGRDAGGRSTGRTGS